MLSLYSAIFSSAPNLKMFPVINVDIKNYTEGYSIL